MTKEIEVLKGNIETFESELERMQVQKDKAETRDSQNYYDERIRATKFSKAVLEVRLKKLEDGN